MVPPPADSAPPRSQDSAPAPGGSRLEFLDGIRGLAALYVALFHLAAIGAAPGAPHAAAPNWMRHGHLAVDVFIVLSGYCLMLPVARSAQGVLKGGVGEYLLRRTRRILPPYYVAVAISLLLLMVQAAMERRGLAGIWRSPDFEPANLAAHLLLIHNLNAEWSSAINTPLWSVATEWQIYFLFPAILLPLWRGGGLAPAVAAGFLIGLAPGWLLPDGGDLAWACPWYVGLFALGMAAAAINWRDGRAEAALRRLPWGALALLLGGVVVFGYPWLEGRLVLQDTVAGLAAAALIVHCGALARAGRSDQSVLLRLLQARPAVVLGAFSYSLYLMHLPAWKFVAPLNKALALPPNQEFLFRLLVGVPFALGACWLFYLAFERPTTRGRARSEPAGAPAGEPAPAPVNL